MPEEIIKYNANLGKSLEDISEIMGVSAVALSYRLKNLGYLTLEFEGIDNS